MADFIDNEEVLTSKAVIEMIALTSEYCHFIENIETFPADDRLPFIQKIFTALYLKGLLFPSIEVNHEEYHERFITEEEYELVHLKLTTVFEEINFFPVVNLMEEDTEPIPISLSECLTDIYIDVKEFLLLYGKGTLGAKENAVSACKMDFLQNWGYKITIVLYYLHSLIGKTQE